MDPGFLMNECDVSSYLDIDSVVHKVISHLKGHRAIKDVLNDSGRHLVKRQVL